MYWDITNVKVIDAKERRIRITFEDGLTGEATFDDSFFINIFAPFKEPAEFAKIKLIECTIGWDEQTDLAPDALHLWISQNGKHVYKR